MFIGDNSIGSIVRYFYAGLEKLYPASEIASITSRCLEHYLGYNRAEVVIRTQETLTESQLLVFHYCLKRLKKQEPLQYVLGETTFCGLFFKVNSSVLIPRPETEELVQWIVEDYSQNPAVNIVDIGTGSGCIAISLKKQLSGSLVKGIDISEEAIAVATENARINNEDVLFRVQDIFTDNFFEGIHIIVSNPPYVTHSEKELMSINVLNYEPHIALFVDDVDPLLYYRRIAILAFRNLEKNGTLYFEINEKFGKEVCDLVTEIGLADAELKKDINGKERMLKCRKR